MPADRAPRAMTPEERETWAWYARWAAVVRAFAVAEREGAPAGGARLRRARQLLDPRATDAQLDAIVDHARRQAEAGEPGLLEPPRLIDLAGPSMARRIVAAGLIEGAVAERELEPCNADR